MMRSTAKRRGLLITAVLALAGLFGCGDRAGAPVGMVDHDAAPAVAQAPAAGRIVFGMAGLRARKATADLQVKTVTSPVVVALDQVIELVMNEPRDLRPSEGVVRLVNVRFDVTANSIGGKPSLGLDVVPITLTASSGTALDDVSVAFDPSGLTFTPAAKLTLTLNGPRPAQIVAYHIAADGTVTLLDVTIVSSGNEWQAIVSVPGFSIYTWDDGGE